jgi:hypothetical protein
MRVADLVGKRTLVAGPDRRRTLPEPLAANDELARLMPLEVSGERAPAVLRGFPVPLTSGPKTKYSNSGAETPPGQKGKMIMERLLLSSDHVAESLGCAGRGSMT